MTNADGRADVARRGAALMRWLSGAILVLGLIPVAIVAVDIGSPDLAAEVDGDPTAAWSFVVHGGFTVVTPAALLYGLSWVVEALADIRDQVRPGSDR